MRMTSYYNRIALADSQGYFVVALALKMLIYA